MKKDQKAGGESNVHNVMLYKTHNSNNFQHLTSEYIGNFNCGFTGSYLFSLGVLHFGSSAVAGFDPSDQEDWPAIDNGYYKSLS